MDEMIILVLHDIRSCHNVGSILRTCEGLGVKQVYMTGMTPYLKQTDDQRLPHVIARAESQIHKTALGAERMVKSAPADIDELIADFKHRGITVVALEQTKHSVPIKDFIAPPKLALIVGNEVSGLPSAVINQCDAAVELQMQGLKESFNVAVATALAVYELSN